MSFQDLKGTARVDLQAPPFLKGPAPAVLSLSLRTAALLPVLIAALVLNPSAWLMLVPASAGAALAGEFLVRRLRGETGRAPDPEIVELALVWACLLPPGIPAGFAAAGSFAAVVFFREAFGGRGRYLFHPAAAAYALLRVGFPVLMQPDTPAWDALEKSRVFFASGLGLGESLPPAILAGGIFLLFFRVIPIELPLWYLLAWAAGASLGQGSVWPEGDVLFAAFFLIPHPVTAPLTRSGRRLFAILAGFLTVLFREYSVYGAGSAALALLAANAVSPWMDRCFLPLRETSGRT